MSGSMQARSELAENYREAQLIVQNTCDYGCPHAGCAHEMAYLARAQVYATLALTAAIATAAGIALEPGVPADS